MARELGGDLFLEVVEILMPHMDSPSSRESLLLAAVYGSPIFDEILFTGPAAPFTRKLVQTFDKLGKLDELEEVLKALKRMVGTDKQKRIDDAIARLNGGGASNGASGGDTISGPHPVLFISANPIPTGAATDSSEPPLNIDREVEAIADILQSSEHRDNFTLNNRGAVTRDKLLNHILTYKPSILHFSGHGNINSELMFMDESGGWVYVDPERLAMLLGNFKDTIRCVVLNACYSDDQRSKIESQIDFVVGMKRRVSDKAALEFSKGFYRALFAGEPIDRAFNIATSMINMYNLDEATTPQLYIRDGVEENKKKFV